MVHFVLSMTVRSSLGLTPIAQLAAVTDYCRLTARIHLSPPVASLTLEQNELRSTLGSKKFSS
jgi:hypothetical protein